MAKKNVIGGVNWDASAFMASEAIARRVKTIHNTAIREAAAIAAGLTPNPDKIFSFDDYPQTKKRVDKLFNDYASKLTANIKQGDTDAFALAHAKNDSLLDYLSKKTKIPKETLKTRYDYGARNQEGLIAFQNRKENGLGLSDRVWKISTSARKEIEFGIDLGLEAGTDAAKLSRKIRENLQDPNKLFRRVRDKHGVLKLSDNAKALHPGQGVYRSSYKNAMRLTRTEVNMAYRTADFDRWSNIDFIVGIEVKLSNNPNHCPTCVELAGKYPKDFKFVGWHPQCRCFAIPIMPTPDEYDELELILLNEEDPSAWESVNSVKTVHPGMVNWIDNNKDRAKNWKSMPYFVRDNFNDGAIKKGLKFGIPAKKAIKAPVAKPAPVPERKAIIPKDLAKYEKVFNTKVNSEIFKYLKQDVPLVQGTGFYSPLYKTVGLPLRKGNRAHQRLQNSEWLKESLVYHEYGHAVDFAHDIRKMPVVKETMDKYRKTLNFPKMQKDYKELLQKNLRDPDMREQITAFSDTLMSLNVRYGFGHSKSYFMRSFNSETEFIAHAFENKFKGNAVFKALAPELYEDMIKMLDEVLGGITP